MIVHVIGKNSYIASNLIPYLEGKGYEVKGYGRKDEYEINNGAIVNCAAYGGNPGQEDIHKMVCDNCNFTMELCNAHMNMDGKVKLIHLSSSSEIFQPHTAYARTKSLASDYLRGKATLCYLYTVWGGINQHKHTFMGSLLNAYKNEETYKLETPLAVRDFIHVKHICRGIEELINKPIGEYHFGSGIGRTMLSVLLKFPYIESYVIYDSLYPAFNWQASNPYFPDTFEDDLKEELGK